MTPTFLEMPSVGPPDAVQFPPVTRRRLDNGLAVWTITDAALPVVSAAVVVPVGSAHDPAERPGLVSLTGDMLDEGAGGRDAIELSEALARLGSRLAIDITPDVTAISMGAADRRFADTLGLLADVVTRPHFQAPDFERVRDLRLNRLKQLTQSVGTVADRAFGAVVFGDHPYGHGTMGTTRSLEAMTLEEARAAWARLYHPSTAILVVAGGVTEDDVMRAVKASALDRWERPSTPDASPGATKKTPDLVLKTPVIMLVNRPAAPQSELRVGHLGPPRQTPDYHALVTLNAVLGGQFTSRLNRNLRETRGITYGARTAFDMQRSAGSFVCDTSVQADATAVAVREILNECRAIREPGAVPPDELALAQDSLTRGYVRHFETAVQFTRALVELATHDLPQDTFDRFVPEVTAVGPDDLARVGATALRPDACAVVVVGDAAASRLSLEALGLPVVDADPEF
jgi:zinc protease